jgi:uncharacterized repeat protein (TIGR01451 family)
MNRSVFSRNRAGAVMSAWGAVLLTVSLLAAPRAIATPGGAYPQSYNQEPGLPSFTTKSALNTDCPSALAGTPGSDPAEKVLNVALNTSGGSFMPGGTVHYIYLDNQAVPTAVPFQIQDCEVVYPVGYFDPSQVAADGTLSSLPPKHDLTKDGVAVDAAELDGITSDTNHNVYFSWTVSSSDALVPGAWVCNFARDVAEGHAGGGNRKVSPTCFEVKAPDLSVDKLPHTQTAAAGQDVTWTVNVTNSGTAPTGTVTVTDTTPPNTTFVAVTPPAGFTCPTQPAAGGTGQVVCSGGPIAAGDTVGFTFTDQIASDIADATQITNTASATGLDPNGNAIATDADDTHNAVVTVSNPQQQTPPDLTITKSATSVARAGQNLTWRVTASNNSDVDAIPVTVDDSTPAHTTFVSVTPPSGFACTTSAASFECTGSLVANSHVDFVVTDLVNAGTASGTVIDNTATVGQDGVVDDSATAHATVQANGGNDGGGNVVSVVPQPTTTTTSTTLPKAPPTTILGTVIMPKTTDTTSTVPTHVLPLVVTRAPLPFTGANTRLLVLIGAGLLWMGGLLLVVSGKRRSVAS